MVLHKNQSQKHEHGFAVEVKQFSVLVSTNKEYIYMGICQKKCHFGFSKSSKFKTFVLLVIMTFCVYVQ